MRPLLFALTLFVATSLPGCAPPSPPGAPAAGGPLLSSLQVTQTDQSVTFDLQVTNVSEAPVDLVFPTGQSAEFVVERADGSAVWRWSADQMFTQAIRTVTLAPDESWGTRGQWAPPGTLEGEYIARGWLTARDLRVEQATRFRLP